jgi:hypothetical protein
MTNRYPGICHCGTRVESGDGYYSGGAVYCGEVRWEPETIEWDGETAVVSVVACSTYRLREARAHITNRRKHAAFEASPEGQQHRAEVERQVAERAAERAEQDAAWAARGLERCTRCGGAGGSSGWPGYTCYDCGGNGAMPCDH